MSIRYLRRNRQPAIKLATVNVIEITNGEFQQIRSFADNPEGNKRAERLFTRMVRENTTPPPAYPRFHRQEPTASPEDIERAIEDGIWEDNSGYQLFLTNSV